MHDRVVKLTVVNDFVCTNCCIGQHELLSAISYCQDTLNLPLNFEIEHVPFRLISTECLPDNGPATTDRASFFIKRYGQEQFKTIESAVSKWSKEKGIPISFRGPIAQSTRAHRLAVKAYKIGGQSLQLPVLCRIFKANLEECKDISDIDVLADIAAAAKMMTKDEAAAFLKSDELAAEVNSQCEKARKLGITGVPVTIIDGRWAVKGGQSSDVFIQIFRRLADPKEFPSSTPAHVGATDLCAAAA